MAMTAKKTGRVASPTWQVTPVASTDGSRFETIFLEHWSRVHGFLQNLVGDHDEAEDLALEAFMRLYKNPVLMDPEFKAGGWLHQVAVHLGLNSIRGRKRREHYELKATQSEALNQDETSLDQLQVAREDQNRTRQVLSEMNPRQAQLLILRYSGFSYREIASALNLAVTSIGPLLVRAEDEFEKRFRAQMKEEDYASR
jgi:RNA polymerase sigma factor (sigma-70 family)